MSVHATDRRLVWLVIVALLAACATTNWTGWKVDDVIAKLGKPTQISDLPLGRRLFEWVRVKSARPAFWGDSGEIRHEETTECIVDPDGTVISWRRR